MILNSKIKALLARMGWRTAAVLGVALFVGCSDAPTLRSEELLEPDFEPRVSTPEIIDVVTPNPIVPAVIHHGPRDVKRVALTFDACSTSRPSRYDERITNILIDMKVPATIFLGGKWMQEHPEQTRYLASLPQFELANHSFLHPHMTKVSEKQVLAELRRTQDTLHTLTGRRATLFRAPYGEVDERLIRLVAETGLVTVQFDLASGDADEHIGSKKLADYVVHQVKNGSIVVMHINRRGWHTAEALPHIIKRLRQRGFEFVTVSELMAPTAPMTPVTDTVQTGIPVLQLGAP